MITIQRISRRFRVLFILLMVATPVLPLVLWGGFNCLPDVMRGKIFGDAGAGPVRELSLTARAMGCAIHMVTALIAAYGFRTLVRLFGLYGEGKIFLAENVRLYRRLGLVIILSMIAGVIANSLTTIALTIDNPPGHRMLSLSLSSSQVMTLIIGLLVLLIARIMDAGRELQEEQQYTV
ncbi:MAG: DUF2975 domain-containing protein, partial [Spirochaetes bacterium]|nr:DUF2975 domain-containing protein [Spirochaetota bacterium]